MWKNETTLYSRVSTFFTFFEIAIGLELSRVQIGMETQCKKILKNIEVLILRGDFEVYGGARNTILVSIDSEIPVSYLFVIH